MKEHVHRDTLPILSTYWGLSCLVLEQEKSHNIISLASHIHMHVSDEYKQEQLFPSKSLQVSSITESLCNDCKMRIWEKVFYTKETAEPIRVGRAATITAKLIRLITTITTKLRAL